MEKTKKLLSLLLCVLFAISAFSSMSFTAFADDDDDDDDNTLRSSWKFNWETKTSADGEWEYDVYTYYPDSTQYARLLAYKGNDSSLVIPDEIDGLPVRATRGELYHCSPITKLTLNKYLGDTTLTDCGFDITELTAFSVPSDNPYLTAVNGVLLNKAKTIIKEVPASLSKTNYKMPSTVKSVEDDAFEDNLTIKTLTFSSNKKFKTVDGCSNMKALKKVVIPKNVTRIEESAFEDCKKLSTVSLSSNLQYIGDGAFEGCTSLYKIKIPNSVLAIGEEAFDSRVTVSKASYLIKERYDRDDCEYRAYAKITKNGKTKSYYAGNVTKITTSSKKLSIKKGNTKKISTTAYVNSSKKGTINTNILSFKSSNTKVVKVSKSGKITAVKKGKAKITVTLKTNKAKKYTITVTVK